MLLRVSGIGGLENCICCLLEVIKLIESNMVCVIWLKFFDDYVIIFFLLFDVVLYMNRMVLMVLRIRKLIYCVVN